MSKRSLAESKLWKRVDALQRQAALRRTAFEDDTPEKQAERQRRGRRDPQFFGQTYLPHYFTGPSASFHGKWQDHVLDLTELDGDRARGVVIMCPRGAAKTTTISFAEALHILVFDLLPFFCLVTDILAQAEEIVAAIEEELAENELLRSDFGELLADASPTKWGKQVTTRAGARLQALGMSSSYRGIKHGPHRPYLFLVDDPENDQGVRNDKIRAQRRNLIRRPMRKALEPGGAIVIVQNMIHADCLSAHIVRQVEEFAERTDNEEVVDEADYPFRNWTVFVYAIRDADGTSAWPERFSSAYLDELEAEDPDGFAMEMMNIAVPDGARVFDRSTFRFYDITELGGRNLLRILALDPSKGKTDRSDYSSIIGLAVDTREAIAFVEVADIARRSPPQIAHDFVDWCDQIRPAFGVCETIAFQELLKDLLVEMLAERGLNVPIRPYEDQTKKELRIERLAYPVKVGRIRFRPDQRLLLEQLHGFPSWPNDDGPDGLEMAWSNAPMRRRGRSLWGRLRSGGTTLGRSLGRGLGWGVSRGV